MSTLLFVERGNMTISRGVTGKEALKTKWKEESFPELTRKGWEVLYHKWDLNA